jgi:uncharacterized protein DUF1579
MGAEALERLEAFVGRWNIAAPNFPHGPEAEMNGSATFAWILDGAFLLETSTVSHPDAPDGYSIIAPDTDGDGYTQHYFDSRGVVRTYAMTFDGALWTLTREKPDFAPLDFKQRFTATLDDDGRTIRGGWEIDHGGGWERDFDLVYTKRG